MGLPLASEEEQAFIDALDRALAEKSSPGVDQPGSERLERQVTEMGLFSFALSPEVGGGGASLAALGEAVRSLGGPMASAPLFSQTVACALLALCDGGAARVTDYLSGDRRLTTDLGDSLAVSAGISRGRPVTAHETGGEMVLDGVLPLVMSADAGGDVLFTARDAAGRAVWVVLPLSHEGVTVEEFSSVDPTRRFASVRLVEATVPRSTVPACGPLSDESVDRLLALSALLVCMDSVGVAQSSLDRTVEHVMQREQFGQPVGLFQAVQHKCADMLIAVRSSHIAARGMLERFGRGEHDLAEVLAVRGHVLTATTAAVETSIQLHGGIGFTWERGEHLRLRRCSVNEALVLDLRDSRDFVARDAFAQEGKPELNPEGV